MSKSKATVTVIDDAKSEATEETFEPPAPARVPVLWDRPQDARGVVLEFPQRPRPGDGASDDRSPDGRPRDPRG